MGFPGMYSNCSTFTFTCRESPVFTLQSNIFAIYITLLFARILVFQQERKYETATVSISSSLSIIIQIISVSACIICSLICWLILISNVLTLLEDELFKLIFCSVFSRITRKISLQTTRYVCHTDLCKLRTISFGKIWKSLWMAFRQT